MELAPLDPQKLPRHVAIIMDGNRRWAKQRHMPVLYGHVMGTRRAREVIKACADIGIPYLSLFAFSTENWKRPKEEVSGLMRLFYAQLKREMRALHDNGVRVRFIGDRTRFDTKLRALIEQAERTTADNRRLNLLVAANYGGRWDMLQATRAWQAANSDKTLEELDEAALTPWLSTADAPEVDLLIRTGGESRTSNFYLWQTAYAELRFLDDLWPAFDGAIFRAALGWYVLRERRFGASAQECQSNI